MSNIDDKKLQEAKAKLACHIEPPKGSAYAKVLAEQGNAAESAAESSCAVSSCGTDSVPRKGDKIRLTEMTSAGG